MTTDSTSHAYTVIEHEGVYNVRERSGQIIMTCRDETSAAHYAALLEQAFATGYKLGHKNKKAGVA